VKLISGTGAGPAGKDPRRWPEVCPAPLIAGMWVALSPCASSSQWSKGKWTDLGVRATGTDNQGNSINSWGAMVGYSGAVVDNIDIYHGFLHSNGYLRAVWTKISGAAQMNGSKGRHQPCPYESMAHHAKHRTPAAKANQFSKLVRHGGSHTLPFAEPLRFSLTGSHCPCCR
jgi:hypothetical protein